MAARGPTWLVFPAIVSLTPLWSPGVFRYHGGGNDPPAWLAELLPLSVLCLAMTGTLAQAYTAKQLQSLEGRTRFYASAGWAAVTGCIVLLIVTNACVEAGMEVPRWLEVMAMAAPVFVGEGGVALVLVVAGAARQRAAQGMAEVRQEEAASIAAAEAATGPEAILAVLAVYDGQATFRQLEEATGQPRRTLKGNVTRLGTDGRARRSGDVVRLVSDGGSDARGGSDLGKRLSKPEKREALLGCLRETGRAARKEELALRLGWKTDTTYRLLCRLRGDGEVFSAQDPAHPSARALLWSLDGKAARTALGRSEAARSAAGREVGR
jgi:hypothetical protein